MAVLLPRQPKLDGIGLWARAALLLIMLIWGLLHLDHHIAWLSHELGAAIMLLALGWGAILLFRQGRT